MAERLSDEELGDLERLAERAGRHAPLGPWSSEALLRLIAEVRQVRKLFEDAGGDEHNVLALVEHWGDEARAARADERAKVEREIVACLRANLSGIDACPTVDDAADIANDAINAIERGEHRR